MRFIIHGGLAVQAETMGMTAINEIVLFVTANVFARRFVENWL